MHPLPRRHAILVLAGALVAGGSTFASAPIGVPLATMVADAEAVAIVRIEKIEEIPQPKNLPTVWYPNRTVTVRTTDVVRGNVPEVFTIRAEVSSHRNPSAKVGVAALVFLSATKPGPNGDLLAYGAAQGFRVIADLVHGGDEKAQTAARGALVAAVKTSRPMSKPSGVIDPKLTDAALEPFLKLLESNDPALRRWVLAYGLQSVHITPKLSVRLVALLDDADPKVAADAAYMLTQKNQWSAGAALQAYRKRIPAGKEFEYFANEVRGTLQVWEVMRRVEAMPEALTKRVALVVTDRFTRVDPIALELWLLERDGVRLRHQSVAVFSQDLLDELRELFAELPAGLEALPFRVTLYVFRENDVVIWDGQWHR
jgi:hypothetical protein